MPPQINHDGKQDPCKLIIAKKVGARLYGIVTLSLRMSKS